MNERGFAAVKEATQKFRNTNMSQEVSESIIRLLNNKALSVSQVALRLHISHEKARRHLFLLWKNGCILRSKYPKEKKLDYIVGSSTVTMIFYTYTMDGSSSKVPFITFEEWVKLKSDGVI